jgi:alpha-beta hydrolase superfamily lysophospholipase
LIWGSADTVYPVSSGQRFMEQVKSAGGTATMTIFQGAKHDFFLKSEATQANEAYKNAAEFLKSKLNSK